MQRPFSGRMRWIVARSCGCAHDSLVIGNHEEASVMGCPAGWAVRMNRLPFHAPGEHAVCPMLEQAMQHAEEWFKGLDVVPPE